MSNGELCPQEGMPDSSSLPVRKSTIKKGIQRTISTAKYEGLVIYDEIEETIEWKTLAERDKKARNWESILINHFKQTHDQVLKELGLEAKNAYFKNYLEEKNEDTRPDPHTSNVNQAEIDALDSFDVLK